MKKGFISLLLAAILLVGLFAGCRKNEEGRTEKPTDRPTASAPQSVMRLKKNYQLDDVNQVKIMWEIDALPEGKDPVTIEDMKEYIVWER